jgi:hypothetical protein
MTVESCLASAVTSGYTIAGLEYAGECWGGSTLQNGGAAAPDGETGCNMACKGNATEMCGGSNRMNLYQFSGTLPTSTSIPPNTIPSTAPTSIPPTTTPVTVPSSTTPVPTPTQNPNMLKGWMNQGCWQDNVGPYGRTVVNQQPDNANLTQESCVQTCANLGYSIAAMEYYKQCFCDNWIRNSAVQEPLSDCNTPCAGNSAQQCGGPSRLTVYSTQTNLTVIPPPKQNLSPGNGNWRYMGCVIDNANQVRVFQSQIILTTNNTADTCLGQCAKYGYPAGGMEYGQECCKF